MTQWSFNRQETKTAPYPMSPPPWLRRVRPGLPDYLYLHSKLLYPWWLGPHQDRWSSSNARPGCQHPHRFHRLPKTTGQWRTTYRFRLEVFPQRLSSRKCWKSRKFRNQTLTRERPRMWPCLNPLTSSFILKTVKTVH